LSLALLLPQLLLLLLLLMEPQFLAPAFTT
jgi:hypothetical protein